MATKTRQQLTDEIEDLCDIRVCGDKVRKIHRAQYVDRRWNPHPPKAFVTWWESVGMLDTEKATGQGWSHVAPTVAFNCEAAREIYSNAKQYGIT